jgi:hypothetical protein
MLDLFVAIFVLMMFSLYVIVFFIITTFIFRIWTLSSKMSYFSTIKAFKEKLIFVFVISIFEFSHEIHFLYMSDSQLEQSLDLYSLFSILLEALKVASFFLWFFLFSPHFICSENPMQFTDPRPSGRDPHRIILNSPRAEAAPSDPYWNLTNLIHRSFMKTRPAQLNTRREPYISM